MCAEFRSHQHRDASGEERLSSPSDGKSAVGREAFADVEFASAVERSSEGGEYV